MGSCLPAVVLYAFFLLQRDANVGIGVTETTAAGNPKRHTTDCNGRTLQNGEPVHERRPTTKEREHTRTRTQAAGNGKKHPRRTGAAETMQHTAPNSLECNRTKSMSLHPGKAATSVLRPQPQRGRCANPPERASGGDCLHAYLPKSPDTDEPTANGAQNAPGRRQPRRHTNDI